MWSHFSVLVKNTRFISVCMMIICGNLSIVSLMFVATCLLGCGKTLAQDLGKKYIKDFEDIVFDDYRGVENGDVIKKWVDPVKVSFLGNLKGVPPEEYRKTINTLRDIIEHDISVSGSGGNVTVFHYEDARIFAREEYNRILSIVGSDDLVNIVIFELMTKNYDCWHRVLIEKNQIKSGMVFISSRLDVKRRLKCYNSAMAEFFGLMSSHKENVDSIKNISVDYNEFTRNDIDLLSLIYNYNINAGDNKTVAGNKIIGISLFWEAINQKSNDSE